MTDKEIKKAFADLLLAMDSCPEVVFAGHEGTGNRPHLTFQHVPVSRTDDTLKGGSEIVRGYFIISSVGDLNSEAEQGIAQSVADTFDYPQRIEVTTGEFVQISKPPEFLQLLSDDKMKSQPVRVDYVSG